MSNTTKPVYGNYYGYYLKRPAFRDARLALLPKDMFKSARVLDVGCNEGWVTCEIAHHWGASEVVGVDIDDTLIRLAWKRRRTIWSQQPIFQADHSQVVDDKGHPIRRMKGLEAKDDDDQAVSYPAAFEHMFGPLPIPPAESGNTKNFPHNVSFRTTDWVKDGAIEDSGGYDVVLAFSITKWIHLNEGDVGLRKFFERVHSVLRPDGVFILEPQEWETYAKARRIDTKLKETAKGLQLRPNDFAQVLTEIGFSTPERLGYTGKGGFQRPIDLYRKATRT